MDVATLPRMSPTEQIYGMDRGVNIVDFPVTPAMLSPIPPVDSTPTPNVATQDLYRRGGIGSPETDVGDIPIQAKPDITLFCDHCKKFTDLKLLAEHRNYHKALDVMRYRGNKPPENIVALKQRRALLLRKLASKLKTKDDTVDPVLLQRLNDAYELLKSDLEDTFDAYRRINEHVDTDVHAVALSCSADSAPALGIASHDNSRWKNSMEDTRVFQDFFGNDPHKAFFSIYDGHNGRFAAEIAANILHHALLLNMEKFDPRTKCTCTFNMAENYDISEYKIDEIHSRPTSSYTERGQLHEESVNMIQQIISSCQEKYASLALEELDKMTDSVQNTVAAASKNDMKKSKKDKPPKEPFSQKMSDAFKKAHHYTDFVLSYGKDEQSRVRWSGCSTLACVVQDTPGLGSIGESGDGPENNILDSATKPPSMKGTEPNSGPEPPRQLGVIHLANAGNSHAVLVRGNRGYRLSRNHTPNNTKEKNRVIKEGGTISESERELRVNSILATTRGLGNHGDILLKRCVISEPYTTTVNIDQYAQFLILASDGVWQVFSEKDAASLLLQLLPANRVPAPSALSTSLDTILKNQDANQPGINGANQPGITEAGDGIVKCLAPKDLSMVDGPNIEAQDVNDLKTEVGSVTNEINAGDDLSEMDLEIGLMAPPTPGLEAPPTPGLEAPPTPGLTAGTSQDQTKEERQRTLAKYMSQRLVQAALLAGARDNITVLVVLLPACGVM